MLLQQYWKRLINKLLGRLVEPPRLPFLRIPGGSKPYLVIQQGGEKTVAFKRL